MFHLNLRRITGTSHEDRYTISIPRSFILSMRNISDKNCRETRNTYTGADKSLALPTSRCILLDGLNISFNASLVIYINSTNIPPIMIINTIYETQNLL
jgi:hypothetical protein